MNPTFYKIPTTKHISVWWHQHNSNWFTLDACKKRGTRRSSDSSMSISWSDTCVTVALWTHRQCWWDSPPTPLTRNPAEQPHEGKSTSCSLNSCGNFVLLLLDDQQLSMSTGRDAAWARELISIIRDVIGGYIWCIRNLSLSYRLRYVSNTKSILVERIARLKT